MIVAADHNEAFRIGFANAGKQPRVFFFVNQTVTRLGLPENVMECFQRAMIFILQGIEITFPIGSPGGFTCRILQNIIVVLPPCQITHPQFIKFRTLVVETPGRQCMIGRNRNAAEVEIFGSLAEFIAIQQ